MPTAHIPADQPAYVRLTVEAERRGVSRSWMYRAAQRGDLTVYKYGGASFVAPKEIDRMIETRGGPEGGPEAQ